MGFELELAIMKKVVVFADENIQGKQLRWNQNKDISNILAGIGILDTENPQKDLKIAKFWVKIDNSWF